MVTRSTLEGANVVRFIATMMIVAFHVALMPPLEIPSSLIFITTYGGFGVPLFYTLSAFVLSYGYFGRLDKADQIQKFYIRRFWRIAPLFYVMMTYYVTYLWVAHGAVVSIRSFITSATFTFNLVPQEVTGFVYASWSIGVEMVFYAVFPLALLVIRGLKGATVVFALAVGISSLWREAFAGTVGALGNFGNFSFIAHAHYFAAGILAYFVWCKVEWTSAKRKAATVGSIFFLIGIGVWSARLHTIGGPALILAAWALGFATLVLGLSFQRAGKGLRLVSRLGETSFSLYLLHPAIIAMMMKTGLYERVYRAMPSPTLGYLGCLAMTFLLLFPLALQTYKHIEQRFYGVLLARQRFVQPA